VSVGRGHPLRSALRSTSLYYAGNLLDIAAFMNCSCAGGAVDALRDQNDRIGTSVDVGSPGD